MKVVLYLFGDFTTSVKARTVSNDGLKMRDVFSLINGVDSFETLQANLNPEDQVTSVCYSGVQTGVVRDIVASYEEIGVKIKNVSDFKTNR